MITQGLTACCWCGWVFGCPTPKWASFFVILDGCHLHHSCFLPNSGLVTCRFCLGTSTWLRNTLTEKQFHHQVCSPLAKTVIPDSRPADWAINSKGLERRAGRGKHRPAIQQVLWAQATQSPWLLGRIFSQCRQLGKVVMEPAKWARRGPTWMSLDL